MERILFRLTVDRLLVLRVALWIVNKRGGQSDLPKNELIETHVGYIVGEPRAYMYSEEKRWIKTMKRWLEDFPNEVILKVQNDYGMEVEFPIEWFGVNYPAKKRQKSDLKSQK